MIHNVFEEVMGDPRADRYAVAGDSAGGNFALNAVNRRHDRGERLPHQILLFSPRLDLTLKSLSTSPEAKALEASDPMLRKGPLRQAGRHWAGEKDPASPELSPLYAKVDHLPPVAMFHGSHDILVLDARDYARRLREASPQHEYHETPGAFHVFVGGGSFIPEARRVYERVSELLLRHES
ncbi:hypothetical protein IAU60_005439 [Kwoniella sp. DSM 27419]